MPPEGATAAVSSPRTVVGSGTPQGCTGAAFMAAVAKGGVITFDCGPDPVTILLDRPAKVVNDTGPETVIDGGGAIWARGGRLKLVNVRIFGNACADVGPDVGGAAVRAFSQSAGLPVLVVHSTFGGAPGYGNACSNRGGVSSIGVSWSIYNSLFSHNRAVGRGGNPSLPGTPGGGSGGGGQSTTTGTA